MEPADYWRNNSALEHIVPRGVQGVEPGIAGALHRACVGTVLEFGCGPGRLAALFEPRRYTGMDINPHALQAARQALPQHTFTDTWQPADTVLAHTVLLHIPDDELPGVLAKMQGYERIVISEVMGRQWRRPGNPPVFNREIKEYRELLARPLMKCYGVPYPRYKSEITFLVFGQENV